VTDLTAEILKVAEEAGAKAGAKAAEAMAAALLRAVKEQGLHPLGRLRTISQIAKDNPAFTRHRLYKLIQDHGTGLEKAGAIVRTPSAIMVDQDKLYKWLRK
jgi:hypothetical protein